MPYLFLSVRRYLLVLGVVLALEAVEDFLQDYLGAVDQCAALQAHRPDASVAGLPQDFVHGL